MSAPCDKTIRDVLRAIAQDHTSKLRAEVANTVLESEYDDLSQWFSHLLRHGCASGMVPSLIYYSDTHSFFDRHYEEIGFLRQLCEDDFGEPLKVQHDLKNWLAWFAFEETARQIFDEIAGEV